MKMKPTKPTHRIIAVFLTLNFLTTLVPINLLYASNNGPNAPEAASFEPVDATDMVNLATGDFSYVLPMLDMDGFPVTMAYHAGIPMDMESSWVGLGWNLNTGAINRSVSGTPDDWKNGNSLDFIFYEDTQETYTINVGVGFPSGAEVGVGLSWGSNKSLSGSVYATVAFVTASIDTEGNYSVGVGGPIKEGSNYGGSMSISGNVNGGGANFGVGVRAKGNSGAFASMGYNFGANSFSIGAGMDNRESNTEGTAGSGSLSMSNFSAGDFDVSSKGFYIPITLGIFNFGFGYRKTTFKLDKAYPKHGFGILYSSDALETATNDYPDNTFEDLQHRYYYGDAYEEPLPAFEDEFVADYKDSREKVNFSFANYDSYEVNAPGISGAMQPRFLQNATLMGMGYYGLDSDSDIEDLKLSVYYHHANGNPTTKTFGTSVLGNSNDIKFYFNGQFTEDFGIESRSPRYVKNGVNDFSDMLSTVNDNDEHENSIYLRQRAGNYVEVFTNDQLYNHAVDIMYPETFSQNTYGNFDPNGIGAYKITAPDGKTYHYSLPVYHYERIHRTVLKDNSENHVNEKRQYSPYATHWLLTAVTGPDFMDTNNNNVPDMDDHGYWVRLDHGRWSDGYVWRSPYQGKDYNTNLVGDIGEKDFGNYQLGRKQIYYLDKIVTRTKTAYFVKDIRYDATGAYGNDNGKDLLTDDAYNYRFNEPTVENAVDGGQEPVGENMLYQRSYQLRLDHIVVVNHGDDDFSKVSANNAHLDADACLPGYAKSANNSPYANSSFEPEYGATNYEVFNEDKVYDIADFETFDYGKAAKVIQLQQTYALAQWNPSSIACSGNTVAGKLTLNSVQFRGKDNVEYVPPYSFSYKNDMIYPTLPPRSKVEDQLTMDYAKDPWGFIDEKYVAELNNSQDEELYGPDNWSLTQIKTPLGSTITVEHEEDDYYMEAFSRKFWQDNLQFAIYDTQNTEQYSEVPRIFHLYVKNLDGIREDLKTNFNDYFEIGDRVYLDLWVCKVEDVWLGGNDERESFRILSNDDDVPSQYDPWAYQGKHFTEIIVEDIPNDDTLILSYGIFHNKNEFFINRDNGGVNSPPISKNLNSLTYFGKKDDQGSPRYKQALRGTCINPSGQETVHSMSYKLLATKVKSDIVGGGLRVKNITVEDEVGNQYRTAYYYNKPGTNNNPEHQDYVSSGITSFAPERGVKFVPYQPELPSPGVMYEHVTMEPFAVNGTSMGKTRYEFFALQPVFDIFDPNIEMTDKDGTPIFEAAVDDHGQGGLWVPNPDIKAYAKSIDLKVNTSLIGQFKSVVRYNTFGHLMSKTTNNYLSGEDAKAIEGRGAIRESFQTMKSSFNTVEIPFQNDKTILKQRLISISSKEEFSSVLRSVHTVGRGFETMESYSEADPNTGAFRTTEITTADGIRLRTTKWPAYTQYPQMGSKVDNPSNKHMLTQEAATYHFKENNEEWEIMNVGMQTWRNWGDDIWRKHKTYRWNGDRKSTGFYVGYQENSHDSFNWNTTLGGDDQNNSDWEQVSEITQYNNFSSPLEVMDINGNLAATKMGYNDTKTIAVCNAAYSEIIYSGAEDDDGQGNFGGEVGKGTASVTNDAHTGDHALLINNGQNGYHVTVDHAENTAKKYKISLWAKSDNYDNVRVNVGGNNIIHNPREEVAAGDWVLLNFYADINSGTAVHVTTVNGGVKVDDFRVHPIASSMTSYVYNQWDELTDILGPNNLATKYEYDDGGRLLRIYSEVQNVDQVLAGGFKKVREWEYTYKYGDYVPDDDSEELLDPLSMNLSIDSFNTDHPNLTANVNGGSGQFEYQWSIQYCQDPEPPDSNVCPGNLAPNYGNWQQQNSVALNVPCPSTRAVYWCRVRDIQTNEIAEDAGNHANQGCGNGGGGGGGNQNQ